MTTPLLLDEMLSPVIARQLGERGHDVEAVVSDAALIGLPDAEILALASVRGRAVVTANIVDFVRLDTLWRQERREHHGIVLLPNASFPDDDAFIGAVVGALHTHLERGSVAPGQVLFLSRR